MFKLESYLTPWLLGYLDKYVKLKPEDFQLSLWGGDAVFNKLDLRLNVIEELINIPITFKSGVIHELRIHIPWTRITSEPVVVTVNTLEFVAKLKDGIDSSRSSKSNSTSSTNLASSASATTAATTSTVDEVSQKLKREQSPPANENNNEDEEETPPPQLQVQQQAPPPAGYIQSIITKVLSNVCVIVNNVIIKFVEDDMVLSVNMKSAECYSVNSLWEKMFVDVNAQNIDLRKILQLNDVTICLDKIDNRTNSKINFYQDPLIYRCSIQSRLDFRFALNNLNNFEENELKLMKLNFYCPKLDVSITDKQVPMVIRLCEMISAIGMDLAAQLSSGAQSTQRPVVAKRKSNVSINDNILKGARLIEEARSRANAKNLLPQVDEINTQLASGQQQISQAQQGWLSWAWSYVPFTASDTDNKDDESQADDKKPNEAVQIVLGFYLDNFNMSFKLTQHSKVTTFMPFIVCNVKGVGIELNYKKNFVHVLFGVSYINLRSVNECCCKLCPKPNENEVVFVKAGSEDLEDKTFHYLSSSLFDIVDEQTSNVSQGESLAEAVVNPDSSADEPAIHSTDKPVSSEKMSFFDQMNASLDYNARPRSRNKFGNVDENYGLTRFGAIFVDFLITSKDNNNQIMDDDEDFEMDIKLNSNAQEINSLYVILYGVEVNFSANLMHRLLKLYDCSQSHAYTESYMAKFAHNREREAVAAGLRPENPPQPTSASMDDILTKISIEKAAKNLEKHLPAFNLTIMLKEPLLKLHPYSHFSIAPIASQESSYECYLTLSCKVLHLSVVKPLDEKMLFDVVSKLTNPSKKLIYDSYNHFHLTIDSGRSNMVITNARSNFKYESAILEPCYVEFHFSMAIMNPEMWNNQYFPLMTFSIDLPVLKVNLQKQLLFILNDYMDNYLHPVLDSKMLNQIRHPYVNKSQMKTAKIRQIIYKRLLEDYLTQSQYRKSEIIRACVNDFKFKLSSTKIMHLIELNCNSFSVYMNKDNSSDDIISIIETSNQTRGKHSNIKDFLVVRAQLPLKIDPDNCYIPDPLFVYANVNEINVNIVDELINWMNYKPAGSTEELLNLLVIELIEDLNEPAASVANESLSHVSGNQQLDETRFRAGTVVTTTSVRTFETSSSSRRSSFVHVKKSTATSTSTRSSLVMIADSKPTLLDTIYDVLKSIHLQICIRPVNIAVRLRTRQNELNKMIWLNLPQVSVKTAGTKCDLEEELMSSRLVELPCTYLRASERTSAKLPWIVELRTFNAFVYSDFPASSEQRHAIVSNVDVNMLFTLKPKYNQYDNLLSSLSFVLNIELPKPIDVHVSQNHLDLMIDWSSRALHLLGSFACSIDFNQFDDHINSLVDDSKHLEETTWEENKSHSTTTISIMKEHDLSSFEETGTRLGTSLTGTDLTEHRHTTTMGHPAGATFAESTSSSISSSTSVKFTNRQRSGTNNLNFLLSPVVSILRETNDAEESKLNFTLYTSVAGLNLHLAPNFISVGKIQCQVDTNNIFEKYMLRVRKIEIINKQLGANCVLLTSDSSQFNSNLYLKHIRAQQAQQQQSFLDVTLTRALISNFNKRYDDMTASRTHRYFKRLQSRLDKANESPKWISELNISLRSFDFVFHMDKLSSFVQLGVDLLNSVNRHGLGLGLVSNGKSFPKSPTNSDLIPLVLAKDVPLLNVELDRIRVLFPTYKAQKQELGISDKSAFSRQYDLLVFQVIGFNFSSQLDNPLIRNFHSQAHNPASVSLYNRAKSKGLLYRPGFLFEDRQYQMEIKNLAIFRTNSACFDDRHEPLQAVPLLDSFTLRSILALPISYDGHLINGYAFELSVPSHASLSIYAGSDQLNLLIDVMNENVHLFNQLELNVEPKVQPTSPRSVSPTPVTTNLVPLDVLLTCENINLYVFDNDGNPGGVRPLMSLQLIQPHVSLIVHEQEQKFELSIFDLTVRRSVDVGHDISQLGLADFVVSLVETKQGEKNTKTGIVPGLFSLRLVNFARLFDELKPDERSTSSGAIVCNECLKFYEMDEMEEELGRVVAKCEIRVERAVKVKLNYQFLNEMIDFVSNLHGLSIFAAEPETTFDLVEWVKSRDAFGLSLSTGQLMMVCEFPQPEDNPNPVKYNLNANLGGFSVEVNKRPRTVVDLTNNGQTVRCVVRVHDFQSRLDYLLDAVTVPVANEAHCFIHFIGPLSIRSSLDYNLVDNELLAMVDFGSFNLSVNRQLFEYFLHIYSTFNKFMEDHGFLRNEPEIKLSESSNGGESVNPAEVEDSSAGVSSIKYEDDLRNGLLNYLIVDDNYVKTQDPLNTLAHLTLPEPNEIKCVDDMNDKLISSYVCWRYGKRRAITLLKILPLPFVGVKSKSDAAVTGASLTVTQAKQTTLTCYLEYLNECTKRFVILREFNIEEGVQTNVIEPSSSGPAVRLVYSRVWRIRLSREAKQYIYASSLVASTRVDSVEPSQSSSSRKPGSCYVHCELALSSVELKINTVAMRQYQLVTSDLLMITLDQYALKLLLNRTGLSVHSYGQLNVDYCEYRFLTVRSLLDALQFKFLIDTSFNANANATNTLNVQLETDALNLQMSQSTLVCLKKLESEWSSVLGGGIRPRVMDSCDESIHFYLIYNDTAMNMNIKQVETEETCALQRGAYLPYTWRTHKKPQLVQIYLPKYKLTSRPFQINRNGVEELRFVFPNTNDSCFISCVVSVETKYRPGQSSCRRKEFNCSFKKYIFIQGKFLLCNYAGLRVDSFYLNYSAVVAVDSSPTYELTTGEPVQAYSRSTFTYELIETGAGLLNVNSLRLNESTVSKSENFINKLINGICVVDRRANYKYWINLYENRYANVPEVSQYCLVLTPVLVLCSYLPYDLDIRLSQTSSTYRVKSNSISVVPCESDLDKMKVKFDHVSKQSTTSSSESTSHALDYIHRDEVWFENDVTLLDEPTSFNIACTQSFADKRLIHTNIFKYYSAPRPDDQLNLIAGVEIVENDEPADAASEQPALEDNTVSETIIPSEFQIDQASCWSFSRTIRVDIRPVCLMLNKTSHLIRVIELNLTNRHQIEYDLDSSGGQLCISDLENIRKRFKLVVALDEYESKSFNLCKQSVEYESDWFELKNDSASPFYREQTPPLAELDKQPVIPLYLDKCWIDLKLFPKTATSTRFKMIYLTVMSENFARPPVAQNKSASTAAQTSGIDSSTRLLTIQSKFLLKNKTKYDFKFKVVNHYTSTSKNKLHRYLDTESGRVLVHGGHLPVDTVLNMGNFYLDQTPPAGEMDELNVQREKLDELLYLRFDEMPHYGHVTQSRPLLLTSKEKAIRQINQSNDELLVSRQCFCVYLDRTSKAFILSQKLMANRNGQLIIVLGVNQHTLVNLYNDLDCDVYIWPRVTCNYILENYVKNVNQLTDKAVADRNDKYRKQLARAKNHQTIDLNKSYIYMHLVPAKSSLKYNYDFVATNQFPLDNLAEQLFFMFALVDPATSDTLVLSQNLCKVFENRFEVNFDYLNRKLYYVSQERIVPSSHKTLPTPLTHCRILTDRTSDLTQPIARPTLAVNVNLHVERITFALNDDHQSQSQQTEILRLTIYNGLLGIDFSLAQVNTPSGLLKHDQSLGVSLKCTHFQLDNQMFDLDEDDQNELNELNKRALKYDFPVILLPRDTTAASNLQRNIATTSSLFNYYRSFDNFTLLDRLAVAETSYFAEIRMRLGATFMQADDGDEHPLTPIEFDFTVRPCDIYLEDYLIYNLAQVGMEFLEFASNEIEPTNEMVTMVNVEMIRQTENDLDILVRPLLTMSRLRVCRIDALVSLQTSIKIYLATYKMPIVFDEFCLNGLPLSVQSGPQIVRMFTSHYLTALLFRAGWLLGSLELIGSPTAFIQQVSNGLFDLLRMPYRGMRESGPGGLITGLSGGFLSLLTNLSAGTITSLTSFAAFVSRNMEILSFDPDHLARQEKLRHQSSASLLQVSSSFIITIMGAIGGLAEQPLLSVHNSDSILKGVSKGLIGLVTKPVGAVAELVNQTGQGILRITGVNRVPPSELRLERRPVNKSFSRFPISMTKCIWKLISASQTQMIYIHTMIEAVYTFNETTMSLSKLKSFGVTSAGANLSGCYLTLGDEILYIIDKNEDMLLRAFYLSQIDIAVKRSGSDTAFDSSVLVVTLNSQAVKPTHDMANMDRLVDFVMQTSRDSDATGLGSKSTGPPVIRMRNLYDSEYVQLIGKKPNEFACMCGARLVKLTNRPDADKKTPKSTEAIVNEAIQLKKTHSRKISNMDTGVLSSTIITDASTSADLPKIHMTTGVVSNLSMSTYSMQAGSTMSLRSSPSSPTASQLIAPSVDQSDQQKQFLYYVDPRLSNNFINIFNSLKRKSSNKGFQF